MKTYIVKIFDAKDKHLDTIEVTNETPFTKTQEKELIGYCRMFVNSKSRLLDISVKKSE